MNAVMLYIGYKLSKIYLVHKASWVNKKFESYEDLNSCKGDKELEKLYREFDRLSLKSFNFSIRKKFEGK